jgi:hypothetical protein
MRYFGLVVLKEKKNSITLSNFCIFMIISPLKRTWPFYLNILKFPLPKDDLYQVWLKLASWSWRKRFFLYNHKWIWFSLLWPLPTPEDHDLKNAESTLYQKAFMYIWPILAQCTWFWRRFLNDPTPFFVIISPSKRTWPFINSLYPKTICTKFDWNWPASCFWRRYFAIISP